MMRDSVMLVIIVESAADQAHWDTLVIDVVSDELERAKDQEGTDTVNERNLAGERQPNRHSDRALFCRAYVVKAVREIVSDAVEHAEPQIRRNRDDVRIVDHLIVEATGKVAPDRLMKLGLRNFGLLHIVHPKL